MSLSGKPAEVSAGLARKLSAGVFLNLLRAMEGRCAGRQRIPS